MNRFLVGYTSSKWNSLMSLTLSILRAFKFTAQNILRNFWLSFITLTIFVLTLVTVNAVLFVNVVAQEVLESVEEKVEVTIYFEPEASESLVKSAQGYLRGFGQVRDVAFVSAEDALASFQERHSGDETVLASLEEIGGNPFGNALVVSTFSTDDFPFVLEAIETPEFSPYIKDKDFTDFEAIIERIDALSWRIRVAGFALAGLFAFIAMLIIFNTIRVAIYVHRDEIGIMKLVGANDWFVRAPFLLEAILYSLKATVIVAVLLYAFLRVSQHQLVAYFGESHADVAQYFIENGVLLFLLQFGALAVLSLLTTGYAMRRYLRV